MKKMQIGRSGVQAPEVILGTFGMGGGTSWQDTTDNDQELVELIRDAYDLGVKGIDTAPVYGTGRSEKIIAQAIAGRREEYFLSTKCSLNWRAEEGLFEYERDGKRVYRNFSAPSLEEDVKESLERLNTDYIDVMIIHRCPTLPEIPEAAEAMNRLKERGVIRAVGMSNVGMVTNPIEILETYMKYGQLDLVQEKASLLDRSNLGEYLRFCEAHQITFQNYGGLASGALAGKISSDISTWKGDSRSNNPWFQPKNIDKLFAVNEQLAAIAERNGCSVPVLALAWLRAQSPCISLLVGARHLDSIKDTLKVVDISLSKSDIAQMSAISDAANAALLP